MGRPQKLKEILPGFWRIIKRFWPYIYQDKGLIVASFIVLFAEVGLRLLEPWPLKLIFDRVIEVDGSEYLSGLALIDNLQPIQMLLFASVGVIAIAVLRASASYFSTVGFALVGSRTLTQVRYDLYCHLQNLSLSFHNKARGGDLTIRVISDVGLLKEVLVTAFMPLLASMLILCGMVIIMFWLNTELMLLALLSVPLFLFCTTHLSKKIRTVSQKQRKRQSAMATTVAESMNAIKIVQTLSLEKEFAQIFAKQNHSNLEDGVKVKRLTASLERTVDVIIALATAIVLGRGTLMVVNHTLSPGDLLVFLSYLKNAFKPVRNFAKYTGRLAKATAAGDRILELLDRSSDIQDLPTAKPAPNFEGHIKFEDVSFTYESDYPVLNNINLSVEPGQQIALVGISGSGKSTLTSLILRLYEPTQGRITIDGEDIRNYTLNSLRAQISVVLQDSLLFAATVWENIAYGNPGATKEEIIQAACFANAHNFIVQNLPQGYDTVLGERGVTLSGGQRQRIAIARAAIRRAPILILDEPTTGLDGSNEQAVLDALERLTQGHTTFLIVHDLEIAARADMILYLENGTIIEKGTHQQMVETDGRYAILYRQQARKKKETGEKRQKTQSI
ncbi:ABC transporter ATP-binding protein [Mastigocoleus testarum]|uniref:Protein tyrosine phosphatase n=1 Tax=Mastigocoleus testarum BC008 TaxID=371196 RepID=A0A0V7ZJ94_9CYAN|nr:ABC transporter ATP-binding protein [Mastigocoleus testarum]KST64542.1 protein tyrosine phosphatase [Mastigocoleus testarum BC008]